MFVIATAVYFGLPLSSFWSKRLQSAPARPMRPVMAMVGLVIAVAMGASLLLRESPPGNGCVDTADWLPGQDASRFVARNRLRGKMVVCMATHKSAEPNTLVVRMAFDQRDALVAEDPDTYYLKDHYVGYPCVLVRLARVHPDALRDLVTSAHRLVSDTATKRKRPQPLG